MDGDSEEVQRKQRKPPQLEASFVQELIKRRFGVEVLLETELDSYDDRNYLVRSIKASQGEDKTKYDRYVFKVHNGVDSDKPDFIKAQIDALQLLDNKGSTHFVRLLYYISGEVLYDYLSRVSSESETIETMKSVGDLLARADLALSGLEQKHPALIRKHVWDLQELSSVKEFAKAIKGKDSVALANEIFEEYDKCKPLMDRVLRRGVIQGDANDRNIVIDPKGEPALLDFGDTVYSYLVAELAIAIAYCIVTYFTDAVEPFNDESDRLWLSRCASLVRGYHSVIPITPEEGAVLYDLSRGRLCASASIGAFSASKDPANEYLLLHSIPAWNAIKAMKRVGRVGFDELVLDALKRM